MTSQEQMRTVEERLDKLESELISCGIEKDIRINAMHTDMTAIHKDMGAMKNTIETLTGAVENAVLSLKQIAANTTNMAELTQIYDRWKGFSWVMKSVGFWGALVLAFIAGIIITVIKFGS